MLGDDGRAEALLGPSQHIIASIEHARAELAVGRPRALKIGGGYGDAQAILNELRGLDAAEHQIDDV
jgi:hypothetical protein